MIVRLLVQQQGFAFQTVLDLAVQKYYFIFLFIQVFLTVALSSSAATIVGQIYHGFDSLPTFLATNLPKTSNYFLSYLMLQALSISAGELVQISGLLQYLIISPLMDRTPREQRQRRVGLSKVSWATVYPVFTNLACIGAGPQRSRLTSSADIEDRYHLLRHRTAGAYRHSHSLLYVLDSISIQHLIRHEIR